MLAKCFPKISLVQHRFDVNKFNKCDKFDKFENFDYQICQKLYQKVAKVGRI